MRPVLAALLCCACAVPPRAASTFDTGAEGWQLVGFGTRGLSAPQDPRWAADTGNPGGAIVGDDSTIAGAWYFQAPAAYLGDLSSLAGQSLRWQVRLGRPVALPVENSAVRLYAGTTVLVFDAAQAAQPDAWTTLTAPLTPGGWRKENLAGPTASEAELRQALQAVTALYLRGEYDNGPDSASLDNVALGGSP